MVRPEDTQLVGLGEIAGYMRLCIRTVRRLIVQEGLPATRIAGVWYSDTELIAAWLKDRMRRTYGG